jgi:hypothetical protein
MKSPANLPDIFMILPTLDDSQCLKEARMCHLTLRKAQFQCYCLDFEAPAFTLVSDRGK